MNISEANAVSRVLDWITGRPGPAGPITADQARDDAEFLADRSHRTLLAGITAEHVRANWPGQPPEVNA